MTKEYKLELEEGNIRIKKIEPEANEVPILGWIKNNSICKWINHLRGLESEFFNVYERPGINEAHITLYHDEELLGWIEKEYKEDILDSFWDYLKNEWSLIWKEEEEPEEEPDQVDRPVETGQLSLF